MGKNKYWILKGDDKRYICSKIKMPVTVYSSIKQIKKLIPTKVRIHKMRQLKENEYTGWGWRSRYLMSSFERY